MIPRLKISYEKEIVAKLMQKLSVKNKHEVPRIDKIILNMGVGEGKEKGAISSDGCARRCIHARARYRR